MRNRVTMPRWPGWLLAAAAIGCAFPALTAPTPSAEAHAQTPEPGARLALAERTIQLENAPAEPLEATR